LLLAGLSAPVAAVIPAALARAVGPDPVFALKEVESRAWDALGDSIDKLGEAEKAHWADRTDIAAERRKDEADERNSLACDAAEEAELAVFSATPTTVAGLFAIMDLFKAREWDMISSPHDEMLEGIFDAVRALLTDAGKV
jgi:hypothetical protein